MRAAWLMAGLLCAAGARGQDGGGPQAASKQRREDAGTPPLSKEDAELVKDLALLERLELLRNLELFEQEARAKETKEERP